MERAPVRLTVHPATSVTVPRRLLIGPVVVAVLVAVYALHAQLPRNALSLPAENATTKRVASRLLPQGWAFFTKSPRDPSVIVYELADGKPESLSLTPHSSVHNFFGLDRASRAQGPEYALLLSTVPESHWVTCETTLQACLSEYRGSTEKVVNRFPSPTFCGIVFAARVVPHPWAWRELKSDTHRTDKIVRLQVECLQEGR